MARGGRPVGRSAKAKTAERLWTDSLPDKIKIKATFPPKFGPILYEKHRIKTMYGGRGAGKSMSCAMALLLMGQQRPIRVLCCREIMRSIDQSLYHDLKRAIRYLGLDDFYTVEKATIYGPLLEVEEEIGGEMRKFQKRTEFFFAGLRNNSESIKSYSDISFCFIDEANNVTEESMTDLQPTIRASNSELWIAFNPKNEQDFVYQEYVVNAPTNSIVIEMNYWDNPWFAEPLISDMEDMKRRNYSKYLHVWEGHCIEHYEGAVYLDEVKQAYEEGRITDLPHVPGIPCEAFFDLGSADATACWITQRVGSYIHLIDYHEASRKTFEYFAKWVESKPYMILTYWLPHDARQIHAGQQYSYEAIARRSGKKVGIVPSGPGALAMGIDALRTVFPLLKFDKDKCHVGIECLKRYRFKMVEDKEIGGFTSKPVHDRWSHGCDAARMLAVMMQEPKKKKTGTGGLMPSRQFDGTNAWMSL